MDPIHNTNSREARRVRVVSWNVGRIYSPRGNNRLDDDDLPRVAETLRELDPDVALLQELVNARQLDALVAALPEYDGRLAERCRYDRQVAALARRTLAPRFEQLLLEETGRGLVLVSYSLGSQRGMAVAVHFDVFDAARRRSQAVEVRRLVDQRPEALRVVGGDFNLDPEWAARSKSPVDVATFALLTERLVDTGRAAGPTLVGLGRVDHVLADGARLARSHARVSPNRRLPLGDHDPLVCDLHLR